MTEAKSKSLRALDSVIVWAAIFLAVAIPLFFFPKALPTKFPLVWIYLVPKTVLLRLGVRALAVLTVARVALGVLKKDPIKQPRAPDFFLAAFLVFLWFSAQFGLDRDHGLYGSTFWLEGFFTYLDYAALFLVAHIFGRGRHLLRLTQLLIVTTIFISGYAILEAFYPSIQNFTNVGFPGRSGATAGNAVILGAYLVMPLMLIGGALAQRALTGRWAAAGLAAVTLGMPAMAFTFSRGAWLAMAAAGLLLAIRVYRLGGGWTPRQKAVAGAAILAAALVIWLGPRSTETIFARAFSAFNPTDPSAQTRIEAWGQAAKLVVKYPLWGTGVDNFSAGAAKALPPDAVVPLDKPHNFFLEVVSTMGVPAFLAYLSFLAAVAYIGLSIVRQAGPHNKLVFSGLLAAGAHLIALMFLFSTINNAPLFYVLLGLVAAGDKDGLSGASGPEEAAET